MKHTSYFSFLKTLKLRLLKAESKKNQAILEQKIDILQNQISDAKKREQDLNRMNETVMSALNDLNSDSKDSKIVKKMKL